MRTYPWPWPFTLRSQAVDGAARILGLAAEHLLDAEELVVLGLAIRARRRAGLDLPCTGGDGEIRDERVFRLARAVRDDGAIAAGCGELDGLECFRQRADLVDLDQDGVG